MTMVGGAFAEEVPVKKTLGIALACLAVAACSSPPPEAAQTTSQAVLSGCAYGEGWYCGGTVGQTTGSLYYCKDDQFTLSETCADTCVIAPPGEADYCGSASASGGGGSGGGGSGILDAALKYEGTPYVLG